MSKHPFAAGDYYPAHVIAVRVAGNVQTAVFGQRVSDVQDSTVTYDIQVMSEGLEAKFTGRTPTNRTGRGVKINSAEVGTPCEVYAGPDAFKLYLHGEEVPFSLCAPPEQPLLR